MSEDTGPEKQTPFRWDLEAVSNVFLDLTGTVVKVEVPEIKVVLKQFITNTHRIIALVRFPAYLTYWSGEYARLMSQARHKHSKTAPPITGPAEFTDEMRETFKEQLFEIVRL